MSIDLAHYHPWHGELVSPWWACAAMVRVGLIQVFRRKLYWIVFGLGLMNFLFTAGLIYAVNQLPLPQQARDGILEARGFSDDSDKGQETGYTKFMEQQGLVVMLLLAFSGSLLVGSDFRQQALPFYLSRRIDRRHYIAGKILATSVLVLMVTTAPALVLFIEFGMFTSSTAYWVDHWTVLPAIAAYGLLLSVVLSLVLVTLSAYLQRMAPIAVLWCSLLLLPNRISVMIEDTTGQGLWRLIDPWFDLHQVAMLLFGVKMKDIDLNTPYWALAILTAICAVSLLALVRRVRAVEVVQ